MNNIVHNTQFNVYYFIKKHTAQKSDNLKKEIVVLCSIHYIDYIEQKPTTLPVKDSLCGRIYAQRIIIIP